MDFIESSLQKVTKGEGYWFLYKRMEERGLVGAKPSVGKLDREDEFGECQSFDV
jgi:hypothetical protein